MPRAGSCPRRKPREPSDIIPRCRSLIPPCATQKREKVDDFYAARSRTIPPLPWSSFPPPFSEYLFPGIDRAAYDDFGLLPAIVTVSGILVGDDYVARAAAL